MKRPLEVSDLGLRISDFLSAVSGLCLGVSTDLGVHIQVENIGQSHQIVKNSDDVSGQIDVIIRKARQSQLFQILIDDLGGCQRDLFGELQKRQGFRIQRSAAKVGGNLLDQFG